MIKNKLLILIVSLFILGVNYSQINISTNYREDLIWNEKTEKWDLVSSNPNEITFFEFEDTIHSQKGIIIHRTGDITSAYLIKSHKYDEEYDSDEFQIISDVGNRYYLLVQMSTDKDNLGCLMFTATTEDNGFRAVKHYIKNIWVTDDDEDSNENNNSIDGDSDNWTGTGTGVFIDKRGYFATNFHVVENAREVEIEFYRNGQLQIHKAELVKEDKKNDLAILKISDEDFEIFDAIPYNYSTNVADVGEEVFALGYPMALTLMGKDIKFTDGKVSSRTGFDGDIANYQTTTPLQPGNSGGPLFDYNGNLIGINTSHLTPDVADNVSYSIKSSYLKNLVDVLPVNILLPDNKKLVDLKLTEKIKILSDYVVLIKIK